MQITNSNPLAAHALWGALTSLADRVHEGCVCAKEGFFPYSVTLFQSGENEHLVITAANASHRVSRIGNLDEGTYEYRTQANGIVGQVIHQAMGYDGMYAVDAIDYLGGLIKFIPDFRRADAHELRLSLTKGETVSHLKNVARIQFRNQLAKAQGNSIHFREFYESRSMMTDLAQLIDSRVPNIKAGVHTYASIDGTGVEDCLVIKAESGEVALLTIVEEKLRLMTSSAQLARLIDFMKGVSASFVDSLIERDGYAYGVLNTVSVKA
jgi:hypothetical protein